MLSRFPYPLDRGDKLRAFYQLKELSKTYNIQLIALTEEQIPIAHIKAVELYCKSIQIIAVSKMTQFFELCKGVFLQRPFQVSYFYNQKHIDLVQNIVSKYPNAPVYGQLIRVVPYLENLENRVVLDFQDSFSLNMKRRAENSSFWSKWLFSWESKLVKKYEQYCISKFKKLSIIAQIDKDYIADNQVVENLYLVQNGVDVDYFNTKNELNFVNKKTKTTLGFIGNLGYFPNIVAAEYLVEKIYTLLDHSKFEVNLAGSRPSKKLLNFESENIKVTGWLDDIREAYLATDILVAPIFSGSGQQNKILEAMAMSVPIVTTSQVASAINATENELMIADSLEDFQKCIMQLSTDNTVYKKYQTNGRNFVEQYFSWSAATKKLIGIIES